MKRLTGLMLALILLLHVFGAALAAQGARRVESTSDADEFMAVFLGDHPEKMEGVWAFSPQMEAALAQMGGIAGMAKQLSSLGSPKNILPAYEGEIQGLKAFYVPCTFSLMQKDILLIVQDGIIAGVSTGPYSGGSEEAKDESDLYESTELALPVPSLGEQPGTLTIPRGEGPFPAVVLLQGSGPSDRDESVGNLKPFRDIAAGLAKAGIAVYRFDKRTYVFGAETAADKGFTLVDECIEDAVNAVRLLAGQKSIDPDRIFVLGHSLGGNAIPAVARELKKKTEKACGFIMMAASPRPLDVLMREQYEFLYSLLPEVSAEQQAEKDALFSDLDRLKSPDALDGEDQVAGVYSAYWKWLAEYDILRAAEEITEPVLLLQGEEDYQVTMTDYTIWKERFGEKGNWKLISYPGLTHVFTKGVKTEGSAVYARTDQMEEQVIRDIAEFILRSGKNP